MKTAAPTPRTGRRRDVAIFTAGPWYRRLRLATGVILFVYVFTRLLDHVSGNISLAAMEAVLRVQKIVWKDPVGTTLLYGALTIHAAHGVWSLYARRYVGWTPAEIAQLVLGRCVPPLLANHLAVTRGALDIFGIDKGYAQEVATLWIFLPVLEAVQVGLLIVAWCHACIGLHGAFGLKRWYERARAPLLAAAVLIPVLALLGFVNGAREVEQNTADLAWRSANLTPARTGTDAQIGFLFSLRTRVITGDGLMIALVLLARAVRAWQESRRPGVAIHYPDGRVAHIPVGLSVLDASRMIGFPHASVCGGRGRCSTCRVLVSPGFSGLGPADLPPPSSSERTVLDRAGADAASIRLACQLRPRADLRVTPMVPRAHALAFIVGRQAHGLGEERFLVVMFIDLLGSTGLVEGRLPFDAVFLLRRFVEVAIGAVVKAGGIAGQFTGDGILAMFGVETDPDVACRQALDALVRLDADMRELAGGTAPDDRAPLRHGVGVACGQAVVAEIPVYRHLTLTALGEVVHVAARLQAATRENDCQAVVADDVFRRAGAAWRTVRVPAFKIRGRAETVAVQLVRLKGGRTGAGRNVTRVTSGGRHG